MAKQEAKSYLTTTCRIKIAARGERVALRHMCRASKDIYNMGLYTCRQHFFATSKFLSYEKVYVQVKAQYPDYKNLHSQAAQQTLKKVHQDMLSFFGGLREAKGERKVRLPKYKEKEGFFSTYLAKDCFKIEGSCARISLSKACQQASGLRFLYVPFPPHLLGAKIQQLEMIPHRDGRWFSLAITYVDGLEHKQVSQGGGRYLGIDLGVNNMVTLIDTVNSQPMLVSGAEIKSINRWYNKTIAASKSLAERENAKKTTVGIQNITDRRNARIKDRLHKIAKGITVYCLSQGITEVVVGKNPSWKDSVQIGARNNQNFVQIPHSRLISYLKYRLEQHGICLTEQEEAHTSKCDALSLEEVRHHNRYMGRRVKRGLFKSATGARINADVNGAINILRKCKGEELDFWVRSLASSGRVFRPWKLPCAGSRSLVLSAA